MRLRFTMLGALGLTLTLSLLALRRERAQSTLRSTTAARAHPAHEAHAAASTKPPAEAPVALTVPRSLFGTEPPALTLDARGELVPDLALRRFFDYYLTAVGELSEPELRALIERSLLQRLTGSSLDAALALLDDYLALRHAERKMLSAASDASLWERLDMRVRVRREHLSPELADAFFADEERLSRHALRRGQLLAEGLSSDEAERESESLLSDAQRKTRSHTQLIEQLAREEAQGLPPGTLADLSEFDEGAKQRLLELAEQQAAFARRRAAFHEARAALHEPSASELRALARSLGLSDRELARITAFAPQM